MVTNSQGNYAFENNPIYFSTDRGRYCYYHVGQGPPIVRKPLLFAERDELFRFGANEAGFFPGGPNSAMGEEGIEHIAQEGPSMARRSGELH